MSKILSLHPENKDEILVCPENQVIPEEKYCYPIFSKSLITSHKTQFKTTY